VADVPKPESKVDVDPNFEKRLRDLKDSAASAAEALVEGGPVTWFRPQGWNGDPFDYPGLAAPFNRDKANQGFVDAVKDPQKPGTTADLVAATAMIDELACLERSFKLRHTLRRTRATAHVAGRLKGHGSDTGPIVQLGLEFVRGVIKQGKTA
jgi:hypothetical protein